MIDESVKMEASSNNTVNFVEGFKSHVIPSLKTALLNPSSEQVKFWTSYYSKPSPKNIWNYLISGPRPCLPVRKRTEKFDPFNCGHLSMGDQSFILYTFYVYQVQINCKWANKAIITQSTNSSWETWWRMLWRTSTSVCPPSLYNKSPPISTRKWELPLKIIFSSSQSIQA